MRLGWDDATAETPRMLAETGRGARGEGCDGPWTNPPRSSIPVRADWDGRGRRKGGRSHSRHRQRRHRHALKTRATALETVRRRRSDAGTRRLRPALAGGPFGTGAEPARTAPQEPGPEERDWTIVDRPSEGLDRLLRPAAGAEDVPQTSGLVHRTGALAGRSATPSRGQGKNLPPRTIQTSRRAGNGGAVVPSDEIYLTVSIRLLKRRHSSSDSWLWHDGYAAQPTQTLAPDR